jgi:transposase
MQSGKIGPEDACLPNFHPLNRDQMFLLPISIKDWLPGDDLAWFVLDAVGQMDLAQFYARYRVDGKGGAAYEPSMMVALLLYAYCVGERSSRRIEQLCERDVAFRIIAANQMPDHVTIARFRREHIEALSGLFLDVLRLCKEAGLAKVGVLAIDGTKVKANASLDANRTHEGLTKEIARILDEAEKVDAEEDRRCGADRRGDELPPELRNREGRLVRLKEAKARLEKEAADKAAAKERHIAKLEAEAAERGEKKRGRKPTPPDPTPDKDAKANVTDPESRIMKTRSGYVQGYNAQAVVNQDQIIIACAVTQEANDVRQLHPMLDRTQANLAAVGVTSAIGVLLADAGYWSEQNMLETDDADPELLIATNKDWKQREAARKAPPPRGRFPKSMNARERMERKLLTKRGRALYKLRGQTVEPVFGQAKDIRDCDTFLMRGLPLADGEWNLVCTSHNLLKLFRRGARGPK